MSRLRIWIVSFFGFSRTETNGFLILLPLMAMLLSSAPLYRWWLDRHPIDPLPATSSLDSLVATWVWDKPADSIATATDLRDSIGIFDPNTVPLENLKKLGFPERLATRLIHFRDKGGKFKVKKDLSKLYGMDPSLLSRLYPYIALPEIIAPPKKSFSTPQARPAPSRFDLNTADSTQLLQLYGIGPRLSMRIIRYRNRLGGFISIDQLQEIYGLDSAVIHTLKKRTFIAIGFTPRRININTAGDRDLLSIPYIKPHLAKSITAYRFQHGAFDSVEELTQIQLIDESLYQKIKPYLTVQD